jgi:hypothetical protein
LKEKEMFKFVEVGVQQLYITWKLWLYKIKWWGKFIFNQLNILTNFVLTTLFAVIEHKHKA